MKSLPLLLLSIRLSMVGVAGTGALLFYSVWRNGLTFDLRTNVGYTTAAYFLTLAAMFILPRIRRTDAGILVAGGISFTQIVLWALRPDPFVADAGLATWISGLAGILAALLPSYVDNTRRANREARRATDAVLRARNLLHSKQGVR